MRNPTKVRVLFSVVGQQKIEVVGDLGLDEGVCLACTCRERTFSRDELIRLVGEDAPLHMIGLRFRCVRCGQKPSRGWIVWSEKRRYERD